MTESVTESETELLKTVRAENTTAESAEAETFVKTDPTKKREIFSAKNKNVRSPTDKL